MNTLIRLILIATSLLSLGAQANTQLVSPTR